MKAGILYLTDGAGSLDDSDYPKTRYEKSTELHSTLNLNGQLADLGDLNPVVGTATYQTLDERTQHDVFPDGSVATSTQTDVESKVTEFMYVQGEFLCTERRDPEHTLPTIEAGLQSGGVEPARIDVDGFAEAVSAEEPYRSGFYDREKPVEKGISHGNHASDEDFSGVISEAKLNELGLKNVGYNGRSMKVYLSKSGFVAIRNNVKPQEYARFVKDCILPHSYGLDQYS